MIQLLLLSGALAADAAAVTVGLAAGTRSRAVVARAALVFGVFQGGMAAVGATGGRWLEPMLGDGLRWVAFVVLAALGTRMIAARDEDTLPESVGWGVLLSLGVATSIDALAAGVALPLFPVSVPVSVVTIGVATMALAGAAGLAARWLAEQFGLWAQRAGGLVLLLVSVGALWG